MVGKKNVIMVVAGIIIFDVQNRILLQRRADSKTWGLNGGFMELGETPEDTARREVFEETGLSVGALELYKVWKTPMYTFANGDQTEIVSITYLSSDYSGELKPQAQEVLELEYFTLDALPKDLFEPHMELIQGLTSLKRS